MSQPEHEAPGDTVALLASVGIVVTEEGKARARAKLADADARWTPERHDALRAQIGLPPVSGA